MAIDARKKIQVILVGVGGATCSGKTTLAKHLKSILPGSAIVHQDDFAPPIELVPVHPVHQVQDWDAPAGAISWDRFVTFLRRVKETGEIPLDHRSHDHLNEQKDIPIPNEVRDSWITEFKRIQEERESGDDATQLVWVLVDGFLLYWHKDVIAELDVRIMLRVPHDVLKQRRYQRHGYHTAVQCMEEGTLWRDPPGYWEQIVYPGYLEAHKDVFVNGDVEHGATTGKVENIILVESLNMTMGEAVDRCCHVLKEVAVHHK